MDTAMPCKKRDSSNRKLVAELNSSHKVPKAKNGSIVESHESTGQRVETSLPKNHEDHIAGKRYTSMTHCNLVHKFIPMPQAMKNRDAKAAVVQPSMGFGTSQQQKGGCSGSKKRQKESPLCYTDGHMTPQKMRSWNQNCRSKRAESCSVVTLSKTTQEPMELFVKKARLCHNWLP